MKRDRDIERLLREVQSGKVSPEEALLFLREKPYRDIDIAKLDTHRGLRQGMAEVVYGAGKTKEQLAKIVRAMREQGEPVILITRMEPEAASYLARFVEFHYDALSGIGIVGEIPEKTGLGKILVATGGTSDMPVAEEAALTAEVLENEVVRLYDVGVAGLHRLLDHLDEIMSASVIIAIAGMEGALASVLGGLAACPVIAVPTSVGYGANFGGLSALLSMLNSCANGVSVVNIDNGFGAACQASMINHMKGAGK